MPVAHGYVLMHVVATSGRGHLRLLAEMPEGDLLLCYEIADFAAGRHDRLVFIPDATRRLLLDIDGGVVLGGMSVDELGALPLVLALGWRWIRRQLQQPSRLGEKVANAGRVLVTRGPRALKAGLLVAQASAQDTATEADLTDAVAVMQDRRRRPRPRDLEAARARQGEALAGELAAFLASHERISIDNTDPHVSVVIVTYGKAELTLACLRSLAAQDQVRLELVVVDNASSDATTAVLDRLDGATVVRNDENVGFLRACNAGVARSSAPLVLLLNNDAFPEPGAINEAIATLRSRPDAGVVGALLVAPDGRVQEAGSIVWRDGSCEGYGRGSEPNAFEFQFRRDVDFVSGAFLLTTRALWDELGGFDEHFAPAYYEDVDYCLRARASGRAVLYEPAARVVHVEHGSGTVSTARASMMLNRDRLVSRHATALLDRVERSPESRVHARTSVARPRVLVVDDRVPIVALGSGAPRAVSLLRSLIELGWDVTLFPTIPFRGGWDDVHRHVPREVEVVTGPDAPSLRGLLRSRRGFYDAVVVSRPHNLARLNRERRRDRDLLGGARLVYDAEAIVALRTRAATLVRPAVSPTGHDSLEEEVAAAQSADCVLSVSGAERELLLQRGARHVELVGHRVDPHPTPSAFSARTGLLFVGPLVQDASPNVDAVAWFLEEVLPRVRERLPAVELVVAGLASSPRIARLPADGVRFLGLVDDLESTYDAARVFIAPTRFAAGLPYKVHEAAAHGVPVVATDLLADQVGWESGRELMAVAVGDAAAFADACVRVHEDESLWN
ncbi:MAG: hypothetical protein QOI67_2031, partial [Gaiellaceae bacterium]|nr:hypothetical protein [Gaiellaceae bacterium]